MGGRYAGSAWRGDSPLPLSRAGTSAQSLIETLSNRAQMARDALEFPVLKKAIRTHGSVPAIEMTRAPFGSAAYVMRGAVRAHFGLMALYTGYQVWQWYNSQNRQVPYGYEHVCGKTGSGIFQSLVGFSCDFGCGLEDNSANWNPNGAQYLIYLQQDQACPGNHWRVVGNWRKIIQYSPVPEPGFQPLPMSFEPFPFVDPEQNGRVPELTDPLRLRNEWKSPQLPEMPEASPDREEVPGPARQTRQELFPGGPPEVTPPELPEWDRPKVKKPFRTGAVAALRRLTNKLGNVVTEPLDELECVWDAIPKDSVGKDGKKKTKAPHRRVPVGVEVRRRKDGSTYEVTKYKTVYGRDERNRLITKPVPAVQARDVYNHIDNIDWGQYAVCSAKNAVQDLAIGFANRKANQAFVKARGTSSPFGLGAGPAM